MKKQVLVTGANKGIGYEIARHLGKSGWQVVVGARCEDRALKAMEALRAEGADVAGWQYVNLADNGEIEVSAREIAEKYPGLSLLVNNAGIPGDMSVRSYEQSLQDVIDTVQVNYIGTFYLTSCCCRCWRKTRAESATSPCQARLAPTGTRWPTWPARRDRTR